MILTWRAGWRRTANALERDLRARLMAQDRLSVMEAVHLTGRPRQAVHNAINEGRLPAARDGASVTVDRLDLLAWHKTATRYRKRRHTATKEDEDA